LLISFSLHYFRGLENVQSVLLTHGDSIHKVADQFKVVARSSTFVAGIANEKLRLYGVQFHPEVFICFYRILIEVLATLNYEINNNNTRYPCQVDLSVNGKTMLKNFLFDICGLTGSFTMQGRELECINYIRQTVGNSKVLVSADCHNWS